MSTARDLSNTAARRRRTSELPPAAPALDVAAIADAVAGAITGAVVTAITRSLSSLPPTPSDLSGIERVLADGLREVGEAVASAQVPDRSQAEAFSPASLVALTQAIERLTATASQPPTAILDGKALDTLASRIPVPLSPGKVTVRNLPDLVDDRLPVDPGAITFDKDGLATEARLLQVYGRVLELTDPSDTQLARTRDEDSASLYHNAGGVVVVAASTWVALASVTVPPGRTLRLLRAEGDLVDLGAIGESRGIRVLQAGTVKATALVGGNQSHPGIGGLTLRNASAGDEAWTIEGRHSALSSRSMAGWFTWVDVTA